MANAYKYVAKNGDPSKNVYYLHSREVTLKNGRKQRIFYFAREVRPEQALAEIPAGYTVVETQRTGMPVLKKAA